MPNAEMDKNNAGHLVKLTNMIQARLPQEIRDLIYTHLWDDDVICKLDYETRLTPATLCRKAQDEHGNAICACSHMDYIPAFARASAVGHVFAQEAVYHLYEMHDGLTLDKTFPLAEFLTTDVFHVGLTPTNSHVHNLSIHIALLADQKLDADIALWRAQLPHLRKIQQDTKFHLRILLEVQSAGLPVRFLIYELAQVMELLEPVVRMADEMLENTVKIVHHCPNYGSIDVKHMLGPLSHARWRKFMDNELMSMIQAKLSQD